MGFFTLVGLGLMWSCLVEMIWSHRKPEKHRTIEIRVSSDFKIDDKSIINKIITLVSFLIAKYN